MRSKFETHDQNYRSSIEAARRAQIIKYAIYAIATFGYAQASLAQIAKQAGISKSVISYHFAGKGELIEQVVAEIYTRGAHLIVPKILAETTIAGQLRVYILAGIEFISKHRIESAALLEIMTSHRSEDGTLYYDVSREEPVLTSLEELLRLGQQSGDFRIFDTRVMAVTIRRAIDTLPALLRANPDVDMDAYAQELATLFDRATRKE